MSSIKGKICVFKDGHRKYINPCDKDTYLAQGYTDHYKSKEYTYVDSLVDRISKEELYNYYEIENHSIKECLNYFNISNGVAFNKLLDVYNIRKSKTKRAELVKKTKLKRYGDANYNNKNKTKQTCLDRYGVSSPVMTSQCREKTSLKETRAKAQKTYLNKTGKKVWNEGEKGRQHWLEGQAERRHQTLVEHNSFNTSKPEEELFIQLCATYGENNVKRNYNEDARYPWHCDFYIPSEDLFIELNKFPTHYKEPFDPNNKEHIKLLEQCKNNPSNWIEEQMVFIWAGTDYIKIETAKKNKLNYKIIY